MRIRAEVIQAACEAVESDPVAASELLRSRYPFVPSRPVRGSFTKTQAMKVFVRDGFLDRYSGDRLVNPGALRMLALLLPDDFPYHRHGRRDQSHIAFWELFPTVDHVVPLALGGEHEFSNFATTSMLRNLAKRNASLDQLGWKLHEPRLDPGWDGLSGWFVEAYDSNPRAVEVGLLQAWYRATTQVL